MSVHFHNQIENNQFDLYKYIQLRNPNKNPVHEITVYDGMPFDEYKNEVYEKLIHHHLLPKNGHTEMNNIHDSNNTNGIINIPSYFQNIQPYSANQDNHQNDVPETASDLTKTIIVWNLLGVSRPPIEHFVSQIKLMYQLRDVIWNKLDKSFILVRENSGLVTFLRVLFSAYQPKRNVDIISLSDVGMVL